MTETSEEVIPFEFKVMTDEEIKEFAVALISGAVFTDRSLPKPDPHMLRMVFMPLAFGGLSHLSKEDCKKIGCLYEFMDKAMPSSMNGLPIFGSMRIMSITDWDRVVKIYEKIRLI